MGEVVSAIAVSTWCCASLSSAATSAGAGAGNGVCAGAGTGDGAGVVIVTRLLLKTLQEFVGSRKIFASIASMR